MPTPGPVGQPCSPPLITCPCRQLCAHCLCRSFCMQSLTAATAVPGACLTSHATCRSACRQAPTEKPHGGHHTSPSPELSAPTNSKPTRVHLLSSTRSASVPRFPATAGIPTTHRPLLSAHSRSGLRSSLRYGSEQPHGTERSAPCPARRRRCANRGAASAVPGPARPERHNGAQRPGGPPPPAPGRPRSRRGKLAGDGAASKLSPPWRCSRLAVRPLGPSARSRPARPAGPTAAAPGCPAPRTAASEHGTYLPPAVPHRVAPLRRGPGARLARDRHSEGRAEGNAARALALSRPSSRVALETARGAKRGRRKRRFKGGARACSPRVTWAPPSQWATADGGRRSTTARGR